MANRRIGLDLITYYDIVLNCSYAINKMGERGFYFGIGFLKKQVDIFIPDFSGTGPRE